MRLYLFISFIINSFFLHSQYRQGNQEDNYFSHYLSVNNEFGNSLKRDSMGGFTYKVNIDTSNTVYISKDYNNFKLYDRNKNLIAEGNLEGKIYTDFFKKFGKWTSYYSSGKPKWIGYYYAGIAIGLWRYYYPNGELKNTFTLSPIEIDSFFLTRRVGLYEEYFENGSIRTTGFYKISLDTTKLQLYDRSIGNFKEVSVRAPVSKPFGIWKYYKENGELERKEDYH